MTLHVRGFPTIKLFILHGADCLNDASRVWHLWLPRGPVRGNRGGLEKPEKAKDLPSLHNGYERCRLDLQRCGCHVSRRDIIVEQLGG